MPHHADSPTKLCACCGRPFQWRKKWKDVWQEVRWCSERCRRQGRRSRTSNTAALSDEGQNVGEPPAGGISLTALP